MQMIMKYIVGHLSRRTFACLVWKSSNWIKALGQRSFTAAINSSDDDVDLCNGDDTGDNYHDVDGMEPVPQLIYCSTIDNDEKDKKWLYTYEVIIFIPLKSCLSSTKVPLNRLTSKHNIVIEN